MYQSMGSGFCVVLFGFCSHRGQGASAGIAGAVQDGFGVIHGEAVFCTEMRGQLVQMLTFDVVERAADRALQMKMCAAGVAVTACILITGTLAGCHGEAAYQT